MRVQLYNRNQDREHYFTMTCREYCRDFRKWYKYSHWLTAQERSNRKNYVNVKLIYIHSLITLLSSQPIKLLKWTAVALPWEEIGGRKSSGCLGLDSHQHTVRQIFECKQFSRNPYEEKNMRLGTERLPPWATQVLGFPKPVDNTSQQGSTHTSDGVLVMI